MSRFILTIPKHFGWLQQVAPKATLVTSLDEIRDGGDVLITFSTGIIVPCDVIERFDAAYNFHAASSSYPGRDAHHWAVYDGASQYGAVAHWMTKRVAEGEIVGSMKFGMVSGSSPHEFREAATNGIRGLLLTLCPSIFIGPLAPNGEVWTGTKRRRSDLIDMCDMREADVEERQRRRYAFQGFEVFFKE